MLNHLHQGEVPVRPQSRARRPIMPGIVRCRTPVGVAALAAAALAALSVVLPPMLAARQAERALVDEVERGVRAAATTGALAVHAEIHGLARVVSSYAMQPALVAAVTNRTPFAHDVVHDHLSGLVAAHPGLAAAWVADVNGIVLDCLPATPGVVGHDFRFREWYRGAATTRAPYVTAAFETRLVGHPYAVAISAPVHAADSDGGRLIGILGVAYSLEAFDRFVSAFADSERTQLTVTDQQGMLLAGPGGTGKPVSRRGDPLVRAALADSATIARRETRAGPELAAAAPVPVLGWTVTAAVPARTAFGPVAQLRTDFVALAGVALVALVGGFLLVLQMLRRRERSDATVHEPAPDIADQSAEMARLRQALADAEHANLAKSEFLARMSHELRTPLTAILGFAQVLDMDGLATDQRASVQQIIRGGQHLLKLINEVLDLARIEAGRLTVAVEPVDVHEVAQAAVAFLSPLAAQRTVRIECSQEHAFVLADAQRLKQIMLNLLGNAIKYNTRGGTVRIEYEHVTPDRLSIHITDTGVGIPEPQLASLFQPFVRLNTEDEPTEGTGLGLALSRRLVELMAGSISVRSVVGAGSTFTLQFPVASDSPAATPDAAARSAGQRRDGDDEHLVLYIEDNAPNIRLLGRIIARRPNMRFLAAMHGRLGLELARQHRPAVILLDLHLPDMTGAEVLRELRSDDVTKSIPVIVVTADATARQRQSLLASGACAYVTKPFDVQQMLGAITSALGNPAALREEVHGSVHGDD
jgi:signal transduction histidine kinase/ActR/RegA family two-component response regulator